MGKLDIVNIPIYVINLKRSVERRAEMTKQLDGLALPFTIVDAVDGKNVEKAVLEKDYSSSESKRLHGKDLTSNRIAASLSHISTYQGMMRNKVECAVILEDDIYIGASFKMFFQSLPSMVSDDWEIVNLFSHQHSVPYGEPVFDIYRYSRFSASCNMSAAYALKLSGAEKLLRYAYPIRFASDGLTGRFRETGVEMRGILPHVVHMRDVPSDIWAK